MRELVVGTFLTLDGVLQGAGRPRGRPERGVYPWRLAGPYLTT
jgi:hypothetical protein